MQMKLKIAIIRFIQYMLFFIPVKKNRIMFYANNRKGYVCNPGVLMDAFWLQHPGEYELIWVTRFPETCSMRSGITVVRQRSLAYFKLFLRTGIFITNDMVDEALVKKRGQIFLSTWHGGGAYKKVGAATVGEDAGFARNFSKWYGRLDYFVSSCRVCTDLYADAFGLDRNIFLETGTPRNDLFFGEHPEIRKRVRDYYQLGDQTRILLFAPSFQMSAPEKENYDQEQLVKTAERLREQTGHPWIVLYRSHYFREHADAAEREQIKDGNAYFEMQDLLYTSDLLVTDFSSCIWDFALTGRPIILLEQRLQEYEQMDRGFFVPYETWPYLKCHNMSELADTAAAHWDEDFSSAYAKHFDAMGSFERGDACEKIMELLGN